MPRCLVLFDWFHIHDRRLRGAWMVLFACFVVVLYIVDFTNNITQAMQYKSSGDKAWYQLTLSLVLVAAFVDVILGCVILYLKAVETDSEVFVWNETGHREFLLIGFAMTLALLGPVFWEMMSLLLFLLADPDDPAFLEASMISSILRLVTAVLSNLPQSLLQIYIVGRQNRATTLQIGSIAFSALSDIVGLLQTPMTYLTTLEHPEANPLASRFRPKFRFEERLSRRVYYLLGAFCFLFLLSLGSHFIAVGLFAAFFGSVFSTAVLLPLLQTALLAVNLIMLLRNSCQRRRLMAGAATVVLGALVTGVVAFAASLWLVGVKMATTNDSAPLLEGSIAPSSASQAPNNFSKTLSDVVVPSFMIDAYSASSLVPTISSLADPNSVTLSAAPFSTSLKPAVTPIALSSYLVASATFDSSVSVFVSTNSIVLSATPTTSNITPSTSSVYPYPSFAVVSTAFYPPFNSTNSIWPSCRPPPGAGVITGVPSFVWPDTSLTLLKLLPCYDDPDGHRLSINSSRLLECEATSGLNISLDIDQVWLALTTPLWCVSDVADVVFVVVFVSDVVNYGLLFLFVVFCFCDALWGDGNPSAWASTTTPTMATRKKAFC